MAAPPPDPALRLHPRAVGWACAAFLAHLVAAGVLLGVAGALDLAGPAGEPFYAPGAGLAMLAGYAVLAAVTVAVARRLGPPAEVLGLRRTPLARAAGLVVLAQVALLAVSVAVLEPIFHTTDAQDVTPEPWPGGLAAAAGVVLVATSFAIAAPFCEELFFRGLVLRVAGGLGPGTPGLLGALATSAVFAAVHLQPGAFPALLVLALLLAWLRRTTGSLWPAIALHALNNALATAIAYGGAWT